MATKSKPKRTKRAPLDFVFHMKMSSGIREEVGKRATPLGISAAAWCRMALEYALKNFKPMEK